jgi:hypothetical protein
MASTRTPTSPTRCPAAGCNIDHAPVDILYTKPLSNYTGVRCVASRRARGQHTVIEEDRYFVEEVLGRGAPPLSSMDDAGLDEGLPSLSLLILVLCGETLWLKHSQSRMTDRPRPCIGHPLPEDLRGRGARGGRGSRAPARLACCSNS